MSSWLPGFLGRLCTRSSNWARVVPFLVMMMIGVCVAVAVHEEDVVVQVDVGLRVGLRVGVGGLLGGCGIPGWSRPPLRDS